MSQKKDLQKPALTWNARAAKNGPVRTQDASVSSNNKRVQTLKYMGWTHPRVLLAALKCTRPDKRLRPAGRDCMRQLSRDRWVKLVQAYSKDGGSWLTPLPDRSRERRLGKRATFATSLTAKSRARRKLVSSAPKRRLQVFRSLIAVILANQEVGDELKRWSHDIRLEEHAQSCKLMVLSDKKGGEEGAVLGLFGTESYAVDMMRLSLDLSWG
eukprot:1151039-Pelagomonas_calceolata.AAC.2